MITFPCGHHLAMPTVRRDKRNRQELNALLNALFIGEKNGKLAIPLWRKLCKGILRGYLPQKA